MSWEDETQGWVFKRGHMGISLVEKTVSKFIFQIHFPFIIIIMNIFTLSLPFLSLSVPEVFIPRSRKSRVVSDSDTLLRKP